MKTKGDEASAGHLCPICEDIEWAVVSLPLERQQSWKIESCRSMPISRLAKTRILLNVTRGKKL